MVIEEELKSKKLDDEIFNIVVKKLKDKNHWKMNGDKSIHHKTENICLNYDLDRWGVTHRLTEPELIKCPPKYNRQIQKLVRNILGFSANQKKLFVLDYINGKYPGYIDTDKIPKDKMDDFQEWLHNEVTKENYVIKSNGYQQTIYFKRDSDHAFVVLKWL